MICHPVLTSFPTPEKERGTERKERGEKKNMREYPDLEGVASPSSSSHGGVGLYSFHH
jgi:hypothetical protein